MLQKNIYFYLYFLIFIFASLPMLKIAGIFRGDQLFILLTFLLLLKDDIVAHKLDYKILMFFLISGVFLTLISLNSIHDKMGEYKFYIKYLFIFPAAFYAGMKLMEKLSIKDFILIAEVSLFFYVTMAYIIYLVPLPSFILDSIVHYRTGWGEIKYLDFQGTFYEAGWLAYKVGLTLIVAILLRYEFNIWPKNKVFLYLFYAYIVSAIAMSQNKTIWLAFVLILLFLAVYKMLYLLLHSNYHSPKYLLHKNDVLVKFIKMRSGYFISASIMVVIAFFTVNSLLKEPIITMEKLEEKIQDERGAQNRAAIDLIEKSDWFGGYGFGFVESHFSHSDIMGLSIGSANINNIYLDLWLQGSLFAVLYILFIFYFSFSSRYFITMVIPVFFFTFGMTNPILISLTFFFLGIAYSIKNYSYKSNKYNGLKN